MKRVLLAVLITLCVASFSGCKVNTERLAEELREQLKHERFEQIYDNASAQVHQNFTKGEFIERLTIAVKEMKKLDADLNWRDESDLGKTSDDFGAPQYNLYAATKELVKDEDEIGILMFWTYENGSYKLNGLSFIGLKGESSSISL